MVQKSTRVVQCGLGWTRMVEKRTEWTKVAEIETVVVQGGKA